MAPPEPQTKAGRRSGAGGVGVGDYNGGCGGHGPARPRRGFLPAAVWAPAASLSPALPGPGARFWPSHRPHPCPCSRSCRCPQSGRVPLSPDPGYGPVPTLGLAPVHPGHVPVPSRPPQAVPPSPGLVAALAPSYAPVPILGHTLVPVPSHPLDPIPSHTSVAVPGRAPVPIARDTVPTPGHAPVPWFPATAWPPAPPWPGACPGPFPAVPGFLPAPLSARAAQTNPAGPGQGGASVLPQGSWGRAGPPPGWGQRRDRGDKAPRWLPGQFLGPRGPSPSGSCSAAAGGWDTVGTCILQLSLHLLQPLHGPPPATGPGGLPLLQEFPLASVPAKPPVAGWGAGCCLSPRWGVLGGLQRWLQRSHPTPPHTGVGKAGPSCHSWNCQDAPASLLRNHIFLCISRISGQLHVPTSPLPAPCPPHRPPRSASPVLLGGCWSGVGAGRGPGIRWPPRPWGCRQRGAGIWASPTRTKDWAALAAPGGGEQGASAPPRLFPVANRCLGGPQPQSCSAPPPRPTMDPSLHGKCLLPLSPHGLRPQPRCGAGRGAPGGLQGLVLGGSQQTLPWGLLSRLGGGAPAHPIHSSRAVGMGCPVRRWVAAPPREVWGVGWGALGSPPSPLPSR